MTVMSNSSKRDGDISRLHPAIRTKVKKIRDQLQKEKIPFEVFEAFRTPERQANLWAKGRTKPGHKVTWVNSWKSIHQYGLAVDFVLKINGQWSWDDQGAEAKYWTRMHELADEHGMTPIFNKAGKLIEKPHIQIKGMTSTELYKGNYPEGDAIWAEHLGELIDNWDGPIAPPPKPSLAPERPPVDDTMMAELEATVSTSGGSGHGQPMGAVEPMGLSEADARFQRFHSFIKRWEGGFVNHPQDNGRATNMGITIATLAAWRGTDVTVADVKNLSREEADTIFRTNYFAKTRCGELPDRTAMVVYNASVLHGPKRAIMFLQSAFNDLGMMADGIPLEVDGILGSITMAGAKQTDAQVLSDKFMDLQEAYFHGHEDFAHFGAGWLNRMAALREFVNELPLGAGLRPKTVMKISNGIFDNVDAGDIIKTGVRGVVGGRRALAVALIKELLDDDSKDRDVKDILKEAVVDKAKDTVVEHLPVGPQPLTPVNAALGESIGRALDGKKSAGGVIGLLATALVPALGAETNGLVTWVVDNQASILTVLSVFTGWGFLGKIDKAISTLGVASKR